MATLFGLAVVGGVGSITTTRNEVTFDSNGFPQETAKDYTFGVKEIGAQACFYPLADFESLTVGAEVDYLHLSGDFQGESLSGTGAGVAVGPFVGYKWMSKVGFTLFVQFGVQHLSAQARATDTATNTSSEKDQKKWLPLLNFNIGWSF